MLKVLCLLFLIASCSLFPERARERDLQTSILSKINQRSSELSNCVKSNNLFEKLNISRLRLVVYLSIDSKGHIERFKLDEQKYPNEFAECIFQTLDSIDFPKIKNHELIELEQPFIFSKR